MIHYSKFTFPFAESSPEERLQKLHTDIKFALKVDNPVSDNQLNAVPLIEADLHTVCLCVL